MTKWQDNAHIFQHIGLNGIVLSVLPYPVGCYEEYIVVSGSEVVILETDLICKSSVLVKWDLKMNSFERVEVELMFKDYLHWSVGILFFN